MALSVRLEIRQGQGLVVTPQLQQAIKLLQMSNMEVEAFVEAELERNPLLQRDESDSESEEVPPAEAATDRVVHVQSDLGASFDQASAGELATGDAPEPAAGDAGGGVDWSRAGRGGGFDGDGDVLERALSRDKTLTEHLQDQLAVAGLSAAEAVVASVLIDAVDEGGYLRADLDEIAERLGL